MGEDYNIYDLDDFSFDVLECYIRHGFGNAKIWQTSFFTICSDEMACMTLAQYYEKVLEARNVEQVKERAKCQHEEDMNTDKITSGEYQPEKQVACWVQYKGEYYCSHCSGTASMDIHLQHTVKTKFCPHCGYKMGG